MGDIQNLSNRDAIKKLQELTKDEVCMFCTFANEENLMPRPMSTTAVEDDGTIWFFSQKHSDKNQEIAINNKVQLIYSNPGKQNFLSVIGDAEVVTDKAKISELWTNFVRAWFKEGIDDPDVSLIKVTPHESYYWDTKHGKMVSFLKMLISSVSGKTMDDGVQGELLVK
jgi:general stress protein 26